MSHNDIVGQYRINGMLNVSNNQKNDIINDYKNFTMTLKLPIIDIDNILNAYDIMNSEEREEALKRFSIVFSNADKRGLAENLGVSERTLVRLLNGETETPRQETAERMIELCDRAADLAGLNDDELERRAEEIREEREKWQMQFPLHIVDGQEKKEIPLWFGHARDEMQAGNYEPTFKLLSGYVSTASEWESVSESIKPYVLSALGMCCYYTGRIKQGLEYLKGSQKLSENSSAIQRAGNFNNMAISNMRLKNEDEAFQCIDGALEIDPSFKHALFNVLCVCDTFRRKDKLIHWTGRIHEAMKRDFDHEDLESFIDSLKNDKDLDWFRRQEIYDIFMTNLNDLLGTMQKPVL